MRTPSISGVMPSTCRVKRIPISAQIHKTMPGLRTSRSISVWMMGTYSYHAPPFPPAVVANQWIVRSVRSRLPQRGWREPQTCGKTPGARRVRLGARVIPVVAAKVPPEVPQRLHPVDGLLGHVAGRVDEPVGDGNHAGRVRIEERYPVVAQGDVRGSLRSAWGVIVSWMLPSSLRRLIKRPSWMKERVG